MSGVDVQFAMLCGPSWIGKATTMHLMPQAEKGGSMILLSSIGKLTMLRNRILVA